jgi:hypothetical protein
MMKGYWVQSSDEWGEYVHADTASHAKAAMWQHWGSDAGEWIDLRAQRLKWFDDKPITSETVREYIEQMKIPEEEYQEFWNTETIWYPICKCELCKKVKC